MYYDADKRNMNSLLWLILILIPMVGLLFLISYLVIRETRSGRYGNKSARKILDERFVRGEISEEEYKEMKKNIEEKR